MIFKQRPEGRGGVSQGDDQRKSGPGRGKNTFKGPEVAGAGRFFVCLFFFNLSSVSERLARAIRENLFFFFLAALGLG